MSNERPTPASTATSVQAVTADDMKRIGVALGRALRVGDVIGLIGPLGAGKTTLVQGIAVGAEVAPDRHVASPTFALVNEHPGRVPFVHADLYRLENARELAELGLDEIYDRAAAAIEWSDRFPDALPSDHLRIEIEITSEARVLRATPQGPNSERLLQAISRTSVA